jgi:hypothetical protein
MGSSTQDFRVGCYFGWHGQCCPRHTVAAPTKYVNSFVVATIGLGTFAEGSILIFVLFDWMSAVSGANAANGKRLGRNVGDEQSYESLPGDRL